MKTHSPSQVRRGPLALACAWIAVLVAGCQTYQRVPLDLASHLTLVGTRATDSEPIEDFVKRLREGGVTDVRGYNLEDGLSFAEGEVLALFNNPDLRSLRREAGLALAKFETAGVWEDPVFGFDAAELLSPSGPFEYGLTLGLTLPISGRLGVAKVQAAAIVEAERRRIVDAEWSLRFRVRMAWVEWTVAAERLRLAREVTSQVESVLEIIEALETSGELSRIEARLFRVALANRRSAILGADLAEGQARLLLFRLMGLGPDASVELVPATELSVVEQPEDPAARLLMGNTQLDVARAQYEAAEESLRLEIRKQYPDVSLGSGFGSEDNDKRFLFGVSVPLPILNANKAGIATARASREIARVKAEALLEQLLHELAIAQRDYEGARLLREQLEAEAIPLVQEQLSEAQEVASLGEVDAFLLLETLSLQADTKGQLLSLQLAEAKAGLRIMALLGPDSKSEPLPSGESVLEGGEGRP